MKHTSTGLRRGRGGAHAARTMMFAELEALLGYCGTDPVSQSEYRAAIVDQNCLGKRSAKSRALSYRHLVDLYGLDSTQVVFSGLLRFWDLEGAARPLIALSACLTRDALLAKVAPFIWQLDWGTTVSRLAVEDEIERAMPDRFSPAMRKSLAQNINGTLTQSGHLSGRARKQRIQAKAAPVNVAYSLLLAYIDGYRGPNLFQSLYLEALDCSVAEAMAMAESASRRGLLRFNRIGDVMDVAFPDIASNAELERISE